MLSSKLESKTFCRSWEPCRGGGRDGDDGPWENKWQTRRSLLVDRLSSSSLREKLNDLVDGDKREFPRFGLRSLLDMAASRNIVSVDPKMLNPVLWRTLPKDLLLLVFARLPLPDINRLRCLSREWRRDMATVNSEINLACLEASSTMVALLSRLDDVEAGFLVTIYDIRKGRWQYACRIYLQSQNDMWYRKWKAMDVCNGGLVCFVSLQECAEGNGFCIIVVNLFTQVQHELPPIHNEHYLSSMVQIKVDFDRKCYKVVVVVLRRGGNLTIQIYDSSTREWTTAGPSRGSIFGPLHYWIGPEYTGWFTFTTLAAAYDFAEGKLELYNEDNPSRRGSVIQSALTKDRMFVLQKQTQVDASDCGMVHQGLCITEYHVENRTKAWVQGKSYECPFSEKHLQEGLSYVSLNPCDGFLMVTANRGKNQFDWLLDLSTCEWTNLPKCIERLESRNLGQSFMCRVFWNAVIP